VLATHPDVCERLRNEIQTVMNDRSIPTLFDIKKMKYRKCFMRLWVNRTYFIPLYIIVRAVINEVLRLFPPVPFNIRRCEYNFKFWPFERIHNFLLGVKPSVLPSLLIQRGTNFWGPSACKFDPDRWLTDGPKANVNHPFSFLPFNGGPRICLGQQFAYHECSYFIVSLLKSFSGIELAEDAQPSDSRPPMSWSKSAIERQSLEKCWPRSSLTLYISGGLWIRIKP